MNVGPPHHDRLLSGESHRWKGRGRNGPARLTQCSGASWHQLWRPRMDFIANFTRVAPSVPSPRHRGSSITRSLRLLAKEVQNLWVDGNTPEHQMQPSIYTLDVPKTHPITSVPEPPQRDE